MSERHLFAALVTGFLLIPTLVGADQPGPFRADVAALGMGNTGIAVPERGCLWTYNPALLNTVVFELSLPNIDFGANGKTFGLLDFLDDRKGDFEDWDNLTTAEKTDVLDDGDEYFRKPLGFRTAPLVGLAAQNFGAALYADTRAAAVMIPRGLALSPRVVGDFRTDFVVQLGTAGVVPPPLPEVVMGLTVRYVNRRANFLPDIDPNDLDEIVDTISDDPTSFHGWGIDLGAYYPTGFWNLALGATVHNILSGIQTPGPDPDDPGEDKGDDDFYRNFAVGASWKPFPRILLTGELEDVFKDIDAFEWEDQVRLGAELDMLLVKLRAGVFRQQVTVGAGLRLLFFRIDFATFVPETYRADFTEDEARVYIGQLQFGWS